MNLDERISESLNRGLAQLDAQPPGLDDVEQRGRRVRRRRVAVGAAVAALVVGVAVVTPRLFDGDVVEPTRPSGSWQELPPAPLSGRWMALSEWTGEEVLVVGGAVSKPCPAGARCAVPEVMARDGAAYDPDSRTWRRIADAPIPMEYWFRATMVGDTMVVLAAFEGSGRWLAYDVSDDGWRELPSPERNVNDWGAIQSLDGQVYALAKSDHVLVLDLATETWSELPRSPLTPELDARSVIPTPEGVVVSGVDSTVEEDGETPVFVEVESWDGEQWTRFPVTGQIGAFQHWTGTLLVTPDIQTAPGLRGDPPFGGVLDPSTGEWSRLPNAPDVVDAPRLASWSIVAAEGPLIAGWGFVYDDRDGSWTVIGKPATPIDSGQSAVWADGELVAFGGLHEKTEYQDEEEAGLSNSVWVWTP